MAQQPSAPVYQAPDIQAQPTVNPQPVVQPVVPIQQPVQAPAPVQPAVSQQAPQPVQPVATQGTAPDSGEARFKIPGKTAKITAEEFQQVINEYAEKSKTSNPKVDKFVYPLKAGTKDYEGIQVFGCFGSYKSDEYCIKCLLRKNCIINR